jgi:hypothetical protein
VHLLYQWLCPWYISQQTPYVVRWWERTKEVFEKKDKRERIFFLFLKKGGGRERDRGGIFVDGERAGILIYG